MGISNVGVLIIYLYFACVRYFLTKLTKKCSIFFFFFSLNVRRRKQKDIQHIAMLFF